jgi:hypothetical protein
MHVPCLISQTNATGHWVRLREVSHLLLFISATLLGLTDLFVLAAPANDCAPASAGCLWRACGRTLRRSGRERGVPRNQDEQTLSFGLDGS